MANLLSLRYILKIPSSELVKQKWNLSVTRKEAIDKEMLVSVASSYLIRSMDELTNSVVDEVAVQGLKKKIKQIKKQPSNSENKRQLEALQQKLHDTLMVSTIVNVVMEKDKDYDRANQGFIVNGIKFRRLLATSAGVKTSTIVYVAEQYYDAIMKRINNGRDLSKKFVAAKLESYMGLVCSASTPVTNFERVLVVHDLETEFEDHVILLDDTVEEYPVMQEIKNYQMKQTASDGFGLIMPHVAEQWASDLHLDYLPAGFTSRHAFMKGMLFTFDFRQFADEVAGHYEVCDVFGDVHDIREIDIVLTTSMLKLWDSYPSFANYLKHCEENHYSFSVTKYTPKVLDNERTLNYQFIQSLDLDDQDIEALIEPTVSEIKEILGGDYRKAILYLKGVNMTEEHTGLDSYDYINALMVEPQLVNDPYIRSSIHAMIRKRINDAKIGVLKVHGNYQTAFGDPYALCQHLFGLEVTGLLQKGQFYSNYWNEQNVCEVAAFRAPMICHNNIRKFNLKQTEDMKKWYKYMDTVMILNSFDATCSALCGCDFDGDTIFSTNNPTILKGVHELPAIVSVQKSAQKVECTEEAFIQANKLSFGNEIGSITNKSTAMYDVIAQFEPGSEEYEELMYRIICSIQYQQNSINEYRSSLNLVNP